MHAGLGGNAWAVQCFTGLVDSTAARGRTVPTAGMRRSAPTNSRMVYAEQIEIQCKTLTRRTSAPDPSRTGLTTHIPNILGKRDVGCNYSIWRGVRPASPAPNFSLANQYGGPTTALWFERQNG
jgi:hypothetical protein